MKIFVVVGSLFPFDRLIKTIDNWASDKENVFITAQIGQSQYVPKNMKYFKSIPSREFNKLFSEADLIVSHAGMGVTLKALTTNKPIIILPRLLMYKEHTTEHQLATAKALSKMDYVNVAMSETELLEFLNRPNKIQTKHKIGPNASETLIYSIKDFIHHF